jgi:hypothetical protein
MLMANLAAEKSDCLDPQAEASRYWITTARRLPVTTAFSIKHVVIGVERQQFRVGHVGQKIRIFWCSFYVPKSRIPRRQVVDKIIWNTG